MREEEFTMDWSWRSTEKDQGFEHERILLKLSSSLTVDKRQRWLSNEMHGKQQLMYPTCILLHDILEEEELEMSGTSTYI